MNKPMNRIKLLILQILVAIVAIAVWFAATSAETSWQSDQSAIVTGSSSEPFHDRFW